jgi:D-beta-D-heptose 7-phosphate kinase/D-beta-D-heptose 1-phosphate adenosyltransferase
LRVIGRHQQLIRLDFENKHRCAAEEIIEHLMPAINDANVLILSDYAKGVIADPHRIIAFARSKGVTILVDPKNADLSVYRGAHILTPNFGEFEAAVGPCEDEATLERKGLQLMHELGLTGLLVTRGSQGMTVFSGDVITHIPTQTREVFDVTGAGDTVIAVLGACLGAGSSLLEAAQLSNIAAGIVVGKLGTASVSRDELQLAMGTDFAKGPLSEDDLAIQIKRRKAAGDKIVMTNGCFDILHAGHVTYLQQARALGDCLIVAVNDDDSIRRLKGKDRPMNPLAQRMVVLAGLGCVDYVVFFREDTPARLIAKILPDVLVKAADYTPDQIAGASDVINNGGEVKIMPLVEGCSTTNLINQIIRSQIPEVEEVS